MAVEFQDTKLSFSQILSQLVTSLPEGSITIRQLLSLIGEQGMLLFAMILTIPFLTPIPLPGVSTVFGAIIMLISLGVIFNRVPWLPGALMNRTIASERLAPVLRSGSNLFTRIERIIRPRLLPLTGSALINRFNGIVLFLAGFILILPLPVLPFSNTLPGWSVLLLAAGIIQRDGLLILLSYVMTIFSIIYVGGAMLAVVIAGGSLIDYIMRGSGGFLLLLH